MRVAWQGVVACERFGWIRLDQLVEVGECESIAAREPAATVKPRRLTFLRSWEGSGGAGKSPAWGRAIVMSQGGQTNMSKLWNLGVVWRGGGDLMMTKNRPRLRRGAWCRQLRCVTRAFGSNSPVLVEAPPPALIVQVPQQPVMQDARHAWRREAVLGARFTVRSQRLMIGLLQRWLLCSQTPVKP
jgi:hypothetical protein